MRRPSAPSPRARQRSTRSPRASALPAAGAGVAARGRIGDTRRAEREAEERAHRRELPGDRRRRQPVPRAAELGRVLDQHADIDLLDLGPMTGEPLLEAPQVGGVRAPRRLGQAGEARKRSIAIAVSTQGVFPRVASCPVFPRRSKSAEADSDRAKTPEESLRSFALATGAEARWTGKPGPRAVVCVNGGTAAEVPGTWSASVEWLSTGCPPATRHWPFSRSATASSRGGSWTRASRTPAPRSRSRATKVRPRSRYSASRWGRRLGARRQRSRGLDGDRARAWLYPELDVSPLDGRRFAVLHGSLDRGLPAFGCAPRALAARLRAGARSRRRRRAHRDRGRDPSDRVARPSIGQCGCPGPAARRACRPELERFCA